MYPWRQLPVTFCVIAVFLQSLAVLCILKHVHAGLKGLKKPWGTIRGPLFREVLQSAFKAMKAEGAPHWRGWAMWKWWRTSTSSSYTTVILSLSHRKGLILKWQLVAGSTCQLSTRMSNSLPLSVYGILNTVFYMPLMSQKCAWHRTLWIVQVKQ